jgi:N-acetyl-anhydromuramyl-L-alanine amidase AmpD
MGTLTKRLLPESNYYSDKTKKNRIIIGNIYSNDMSFIEGWKLRHNGKYKKTCHFTIDKSGKTYHHIPVENYSDFINIPEIDKETISIGLLNLGWIRHDIDKTRWVDWRGYDIDIPSESLIQKKWRDYEYWYPYSDKQIISLVKLINKLRKEQLIEKLMINSNTLLVNKKEFWPISFRSNYLYYKTDVSPAFPFSEVINQIN